MLICDNVFLCFLKQQIQYGEYKDQQISETSRTRTVIGIFYKAVLSGIIPIKVLSLDHYEVLRSWCHWEKVNKLDIEPTSLLSL